METNLASLFLYGVTTVSVGAILTTGTLAIKGHEAEPLVVDVPVLAPSETDSANSITDEVQLNNTDKTEVEEHSTPVEEEKSVEKPAISSSNSWGKPAENPKPHASTRPQYIAMYSGLCPSQQPKDSGFWETESRQAAVGAYTEGYNLKSVVEQYWEYNKAGMFGVQGMAPVDTFWNLHIREDTKASYHTYLYVNWDNYEAGWKNDHDGYDRTNFYEKYGQDYPPEWDEAVAETTQYLHYLEDTYNARCPND